MTTLLAFAVGAQARPDAATQAAARRIAGDFSRALAAKDLAWCERHITPGFVYRGQKGDRQDRDWMLGRIRTWFHPLGYHVEPSLSLVSARQTANGLLLVSDLKVRAQLFGFRRMPLTETTLRGESLWRPATGEWSLVRLVEISSKKTVDGKAVEG